jgi:hypothetical protein
MTSAKTCLKRFYLEYEKRIRRYREGQALRTGSMVHAALDVLSTGTIDDAIKAIDRNYADYPAWCMTIEEQLEWKYERATVMGLVVGYDWRWSKYEGEFVVSELSFDIPLMNPETGGSSTAWMLSGKTDKIVYLRDGRMAIREHKTTSDDISPESDYWLRLRIDQQISLYFMAAKRLGYDVETIEYDVIRKPTIRPYRATPEESRKYTKDGNLYSNQRESDETPDEFQLRLLNDIGERPDYYYARREIPRMESDLEDFSYELWQQQRLLSDCRRYNRWFRNTSSCIQPYKCAYFDLCVNGWCDGQPLPDGYIIVDDPHPELINKRNNNGTESTSWSEASGNAESSSERIERSEDKRKTLDAAV